MQTGKPSICSQVVKAVDSSSTLSQEAWVQIPPNAFFNETLYETLLNNSFVFVQAGMSPGIYFVLANSTSASGGRVHVPSKSSFNFMAFSSCSLEHPVVIARRRNGEHCFASS